ncbi:hypothetical protein M431DRAFT_489156 [Trichoderma harzianum CBS 226.95]|uniref:Uncharacterized protein n=1 Tax=Trichoderma harzianum CBS 226.95 TaxID=983964 RepID=A0A2T4ATJ2_TRIHA|nr:hypothetical protein M431DRAFT_489156 [Trichoderma harzianum CBS 226.95]PTB60387.1 hypothetical protein M431DRAFT_489156 [Trichoderma harzianum CBS 226.95]
MGKAMSKMAVKKTRGTSRAVIQRVTLILGQLYHTGLPLCFCFCCAKGLCESKA